MRPTTVLMMLVVGVWVFPSSSRAQAIPDLSIRDFNPQPNLKVASTELGRARFPVIDGHTHFGLRLKGDVAALAAYVATMDAHNIAICVSLDAKLGSEQEHQEFLWTHYPNRFLTFAHLDFRGKGDAERPETWRCNQPGFVRDSCEQLKRASQNGIVGLKLFKQFGLGYRDANHRLIEIDDPRFDPIWRTCGELKLPVIIHTGDPAAFFAPIDKTNERYEELSRHPEWSFFGKDFPDRGSLLAARNRVIARHPTTNFIGAHMAGNPEDLAEVGRWLDAYPNLHVEFASRIAELGRQPFTSRKFILKYQDRILFGTDGPWPELRLKYYWRFLETNDEYFPYSEKVPPPQGLWRIYGLGLPDQVLRKVYSENFLNLVPGGRVKFEAAVKRLGSKEPGSTGDGRTDVKDVGS